MSDPIGPSEPSAASDTLPPDSQALTLDLEPAPRSRTGYIVVAVILVVIVLVVVAAMVIGRKPAGYSADDKQMFMSACTAAGGDGVKDTCGCIYDELSQKVPYETYVSIDSTLQEQRAKAAGAALQFPAEVDAIRATCVSRSKPPVKEPPTSLDRPTVKEPASGP